MGDSARQQHGSHPVMRVYTFGEFVLEQLVSPQPSAAHAPRYERVAQEEWHSRGPAKRLLKVLLCRSRRRVSREELLEALWPEEESIDAGFTIAKLSEPQPTQELLATHPERQDETRRPMFLLIAAVKHEQ
jgi:hypothetical protein